MARQAHLEGLQVVEYDVPRGESRETVNLGGYPGLNPLFETVHCALSRGAVALSRQGIARCQADFQAEVQVVQLV